MRYGIVLLVLTILWLPLPGWAEQIQGQVVGISDGDTFTLLQDGHQQTKIRLGEIDTPESKQPYGHKAKQELSSLIYSKTVTVIIQDTDRYGRTVGRVFTEDTDVNAEMIRRGAAWVYRKYAKDQTLYQLEAEAKHQKRGLWNLPESERIPPWEWRHPTTGNTTPDTPQNQTQNQSGGGGTCGDKRVCRQMTSCDEARYYLTTCGLSSLDGNHDGTPCSKLCR